MKNIDVKELIEAMGELEKERGIEKEYLIESLEAALVTAYKKNFDSVDNVKVTIDSESGEIHIYSVRDVVEVQEDPLLEISVEDARKIDSSYNVGDVVNLEIRPKDFGRIAAQTAKQVVVQKIREAETATNSKTDEVLSIMYEENLKNAGGAFRKGLLAGSEKRRGFFEDLAKKYFT